MMTDDEASEMLKQENRFTTIIYKAQIMKMNMEKKKLTRAKSKCPFCNGHWYAVLAEPKKHIHLHCDGNCKTMLMS